MSRSSGEEGHELSEKSSLDIEHSTANDDQAQHLLDSYAKDDQDNSSAAKHANSRRSILWWSLSLTAIFVSLAGTSWYVFRALKRNDYGNTDPGETTIQTNDYILDPKWNYNAAPRRREFTWTVRDHVHNPDGVYRPMILVNNMYPGPCIEANEGDTIVVHVNNQASNATAMHWHGIYQSGSPHMDGTVGVTQCPIAPGATFTYEFTVTGQSGTYWWHGHVGLQASDGLHGPLIIHSREERTDQKLHYDTDRVILLSDHYHDLSSALLWQYLKPGMETQVRITAMEP